MDALDYSLALRDCLKRSWWLRRLGVDGRWLVRQAVALVEMQPAIAQADLRPLKDALRARLYRQPPGRRLRRWLLSNLGVPLVADLVFQWWRAHSASGPTRQE